MKNKRPMEKPLNSSTVHLGLCPNLCGDGGGLGLRQPPTLAVGMRCVKLASAAAASASAERAEN